MPKIQAVLSAGGTAPLDFTLHDAGHSFRVAKRMGELLSSPDDTLGKLSVYELALLLLAAYLHDIGMVPERSKVVLHRRYLLSGEHSALSSEEFEEYQAWLDSNAGGLEPPLAGDRFVQAEELVTYYCRHKHNDWSEKWIREHLAGVDLGYYTHWIVDLVA